MELFENQQNPSPLGTLGKHPKGEKLSLTKVNNETEDFLHEVFTKMENKDCKDLRRQFIVPDMPFTMALYLDKVMAVGTHRVLKLLIRHT